MAEAFDPRVTPARGDIAAAHLEGIVSAPRYVTGTLYEVVAGIAPVTTSPSIDAALTTQAIRGERVTIYDADDAWAWGQLARDGYVGFIPRQSLRAAGVAPTHVVTALRTFAFPSESIKRPPRDGFPMGAELTIIGNEGMFALTDDGLFVPMQHLAILGTDAADPVAIAEQFLGTPYLWGGKTSLGVDCSGLVQTAHQRCGIPCPRDSDMQQAALGARVAIESWTPERGDLIFWKGHVALVRDRDSIIHANAHHMATAIEPLAEAIARIAAAGDSVQAIRRLRSTGRATGRD